MRRRRTLLEKVEALLEPAPPVTCPHCGGRYIEPLEMFRTIWECYDCGKTFEVKR